MKPFFSLTSLLLCVAFLSHAQKLSNPFKFPMQLSGGFCDLRANHFHAGIDIRTGGIEGRHMYSVSKGFISRVSVSPWGYGNAVYITHPADSLVTVYGHLQRFNPKVAEIVKQKQYEQESFAVDFTFEPDELPVNQGDLIGYSGNSGSSGGPHLHFEVRDLRTNELTDPLTYYKSIIPDKRKPILRGLMIYPMEGKGIVNGSVRKQKIEFQTNADDTPTITSTVEAWGEIGFSLKAIDKMDGTNFSYGIKEIKLLVDQEEIFKFTAKRYSFEESPFINSCIDYEEWRNGNGFFFKTFIDPNNHLRMMTSKNSGIIDINEERVYHAKITLTDSYGNANHISIKVKGKKQTVPSPDTENARLMLCNRHNSFETDSFRLNIPENTLYRSVYMNHQGIPSAIHKSLIHSLHPTPIPLHKPAKLAIRMDNKDCTDKYGIVRLKNATDRGTWIGGTFKDGWIETDIRELGIYAIAQDTVKPTITPITPHHWRTDKKAQLLINDDFSGIASFRGEIDGQYALFEYDAKKNLLVYQFDDERLTPKYHRLKLTVVDNCGNISVYEDAFTW